MLLCYYPWFKPFIKDKYVFSMTLWVEDAWHVTGKCMKHNSCFYWGAYKNYGFIFLYIDNLVTEQNIFYVDNKKSCFSYNVNSAIVFL